MGSGASIPQEKHIVIIGGGYAGAGMGMYLKKANAKFTIINANIFFHHNVGATRAIVEKDFFKKTMFTLDNVFGNENFKVGKVTSINVADKKVILESGDEISYDILVIATGSTGNFPHKIPQQVAVDDDYDTIKERYTKTTEKVESSKRILVIGGGPTGVEQACEVASKYPDKEVTLIHSGDKLIGDFTVPKFDKRCHEILESLKIKVILGERINDLASIPDETHEGPITVTTDKGTTMEVDYVSVCIGLRVATDAYKDVFSEQMTEEGRLKVDDYLQVEGHEDIYAIGDCNATPEAKLAYLADEQAKFVTNNLKKKFAGKARDIYKPGNLPVTMVLALGPRNGIGQLTSGSLLPEFACKMLKSKDMMASRTFKKFGQKLPK